MTFEKGFEFISCFSLRNSSFVGYLIHFGRRRILTPENSDKILNSGENRTHNHPSSTDAPATELVEALRRAGSKFDYK